MSNIRDHIVVNITREAAVLAQVGFGIPLALCCFNTASPSAGTTFTTRTKTYSSLTAVQADFTDDAAVTTKIFSPEVVNIASRIFGQARAPRSLVVGRRVPGTTAAEVTIAGTLAENDTFTITINGVDYTATADSTPLATEVATALAALINADTSQNVTATPTSGVVVIDADANSTFTWSVSKVSALGTITGALDSGNVAAEDADTALAAVIAENNGFFYVVPGFQGRMSTEADTDAKDLADYIEGIKASNPKYLVACTSATDTADNVFNLSGTDLGNEFYAEGYDNATLFFAADALNYPNAAIVGLQATKQPGSSTWKFKQVSGVATDSLTDTQRTNLDAKNVNYIETIAGLNAVTSTAKSASGEYIDVIVGAIWLQTEISRKVFILLVNAEKVPITNSGISLVAKEVQAQLAIASKDPYNLVDGATIVVTQPDVTALDTADKALRFLNGITFSATLQGAVHKVQIDGKLSV